MPFQALPKGKYLTLSPMLPVYLSASSDEERFRYEETVWLPTKARALQPSL